MTLRKQLFMTKPVHVLLADIEGDHGLRRVLGPVSLTALGVGAIIGAGIFVLTGLAANQYAGPALVLSFVVAGIGCTLAALCYAEFAAMVPVAGSAYTYAYATLGELFAWIIGWDLVLEYAVASSTVAHGWSHYFVSFLGIFDIELPHAWINSPFDFDPALGEWVVTGAVMNLPALLVVLAVTVVLVIGIRESANFNAAMVILKLAVVLFVIVVGAGYVDTANWHPYMPYGPSGVLKGAAYVFFAYIGFDSVSTHAEEARNPQRDVPIGIIVSLLLCTVLYILVAAVLTGMVPYHQIDLDAPVAQAFAARGLPDGSAADRGGRGGRHHERAAGAAAQPGSHPARPGARRPHLTQLLRRRASALPHAVQGDHLDGHPGGARRRALPAEAPRRPGQHRHPDGLRHRVRRRHRDAPHESPSCTGPSGRPGCHGCPSPASW